MIANQTIEDLAAEFRAIRPEVLGAVSRVLDSGRFTLSREVEALEEEICEQCGVRYAIGVSSGSTALELALAAAEIGPGDEVVTVSNTDPAIANAICRAGARIAWADIDIGTFNIDVRGLETRIGSRTKAIVVTHMHGRPVEMDPVLAIAARHQLVAIEDAALAWRAEYDHRRAGSMATIGCFSFAPTKVLGGIGDAGAVVTNDASIASRLRVLRRYGHLENPQGSSKLDWTFVDAGMNGRMDEIQAAILSIRLSHVEEYVAQRRRNAALYSSLLSGLPLLLPNEDPKAFAVYRAYTLCTEGRDELREHLSGAGVETRTYYSPSLHVQPAYKHVGRFADALPATDKADREAISIPVHPSLREADIRFIADAISAFFSATPVRA